MPLCVVTGCSKEKANGGMCWGHYRRNLRHGDPLAGPVSAGAPLAVRLERGLPADLDPAKCWRWTRGHTTHGYGVVTLPGGGSRLAHVAMYETRVGPVPAGMELDHLCRTKACVNPAHLEPVTRAENVRRGWPFRADWAGGRRRATA